MEFFNLFSILYNDDYINFVILISEEEDFREAITSQYLISRSAHSLTLQLYCHLCPLYVIISIMQSSHMNRERFHAIAPLLRGRCCFHMASITR